MSWKQENCFEYDGKVVKCVMQLKICINKGAGKIVLFTPNLLLNTGDFVMWVKVVMVKLHCKYCRSWISMHRAKLKIEFWNMREHKTHIGYRKRIKQVLFHPPTHKNMEYNLHLHSAHISKEEYNIVAANITKCNFCSSYIDSCFSLVLLFFGV